MPDRTGIEWTDATWQVTHGCSLVSPGCTHCYAMRMAARLERMCHTAYQGLTQPSAAGAVWSGLVREADLGGVPQPLRWRKPRRIFVNSMSDLFHDDIRRDHIAQVFGIMGCAQQHTFQVLTKRPDRMAKLLVQSSFWDIASYFCSYYAETMDDPLALRTHDFRAIAKYGTPENPLPNVWLGTSVERQDELLDRCMALRCTPASLRFLSCEPLLGPLDLLARRQITSSLYQGCSLGSDIRWVIAGGESGPGWRMMQPEWALSLRAQCRAAGVPFFLKQMAGREPIPADMWCQEVPAL